MYSLLIFIKVKTIRLKNVSIQKNGCLMERLIVNLFVVSFDSFSYLFTQFLNKA